MLAVICVALTVLADGATKDVKVMTKTLNDGTHMPVVGLGTWKSSPGEVEQAVLHAICQAGYRHIDAAQIYNNQQEVGRGIQKAIIQCGVAREDIWVTSKIWNVDFKHVPEAVHRILQELDLVYIDQVLLHWPTPYKKPPAGCPPECPYEFDSTDDAQRPRGRGGELVLSDYPLAKTWQDLERVRNGGKVRSIGVSNFSPSEIDGLAVDRSSIVPAVNQVEAHVFWNQAGLREAMHKRGIALVAYSPLGNPALYGDKMDGIKSGLIVDTAYKANLTPAQVMLNFLVSLGDVVVPKSVTLSRISSNIDFALNLTDADVAKLAREATQSRMSNPKNRPGGRPVFVDVVGDAPAIPEILIRLKSDEL